MSTGLMERPTATVASWDDEDVDEVGAASERSALDLLSPIQPSPGDAQVGENKASKKPDVARRRLFDELADELSYAARGLSSTRLALQHPAFAEITAMGNQTIPWLVERLETPGDRPIVLRLLGSLTRFQPGAGRDTIPEAAEAWIAWAKRQG
jgi:hypothetical protein